ncbi:metal ABC transporter substrate-binding protein [Pilimelia columellifera]|uniref:Zinc ABC transporter substrate-binding protein n=1 Tax=Pilimelia columellifera subsp. columellifera TaxID=706583 RepID=A0ABN3NPG8_9ACTN
MWYRSPRTAAALSCLAVLLPVTACAGKQVQSDPARVDVVAAFYPLQFVAERIGGGRVTVTNLTKAGAEPHDLELTPPQLEAVAAGELVVYLKGFQPAVDEAVKQAKGKRLNVAEAVPLTPATHEDEHAEEEGEHAGEELGVDPHLWLDTERYGALAAAIADQLAAADPDGAADYRARLLAFQKDLAGSHIKYEKGLRDCQRREIFTNHAAFGYLATRWKLKQIPISGLSPDQEPAPRRMAEIAAQAKQRGATTIFFETLVSPKVAETVARSSGAKTAVLDPIEGVTGDDDYFVVMNRNLATLREALSCK